MANRDHTGTYMSWRRMRTRCRTTYYKKEVRITSAWNTFAGFLADMGERPEGKTLGRIDNEGDYCVENCRWETVIEQALNRKTASRYGSYLYKDRNSIRVQIGPLGVRRSFKTLEEATFYRDAVLGAAPVLRVETLI